METPGRRPHLHGKSVVRLKGVAGAWSGASHGIVGHAFAPTRLPGMKRKITNSML